MNRRPCWVEISTRAFEDNYRLLARATPEISLLAIVKADAYGHSLPLCAPAAVRAGAQWLGVTSVEEGVTARAACATANILVISGPFPGQGSITISHRLTPVVWEPWQLDELEAAARATSAPPRSVAVHLELDTGMSRQGVTQPSLPGILARFNPESPLQFEGLMTHLYAADESDGHATTEQMDRLDTMLAIILAEQHQPRLLHVGNSAALLGATVGQRVTSICVQHGLTPMLRPGLALYGIVPQITPAASSTPASQLQPVLAWKTRIVSIRAIESGQAVGYNGTFIATEPMRIALLAVGYADGLKRSLSNRGSILIHGQRAPIIGRISMDQSVVDITEIPNAAPGDEAVLLGRQGTESIPVEEHAALANTIPWEIFTSIAARVERVPVP